MGDIKSNQLEPLLKILLDQTYQLEKIVLNEETDPEDWNLIIDNRQKTMDQISSLLELGYLMPIDLRDKYILPSHQINERLLPSMNEKRDALNEKMSSITSTKNTVKKYNQYSNIAYYSSFFDQKK